jgi:hypothetical protein
MGKLEKLVKNLQNKITDLGASLPLPNFGAQGNSKRIDPNRS